MAEEATKIGVVSDQRQKDLAKGKGEDGGSSKQSVKSAGASGTSKVPAKKAENKAGKKGGKLKLASDTKNKSAEQKQRKRLVRSFPASTFEDALTLAQAIQQFASGQKVRRLTLYDYLKKSPDSGDSRQQMTNSSRYGLTTGSHHSEYLELTPEGRTATSPENSERQRLLARFKLAIENIPPFKDLYDQLKGSKLPAQAVLRDLLIEKGYNPDEVAECVDTFILNAKFLGILRPLAGAERLLSIEHVLDEKGLSSSGYVGVDSSTLPRTDFVPPASLTDIPVSGADDWVNTCFYITPIGASGTPERQHADLFLGAIIEPALEEFKLKVVRADQIAQPGLITTQIIEHVVKSRLVIADLSFHNANVFYELCLRHACRLPTVQIIRVGDPIPFDLNQVRTIQIDTTSIYTLVPQLETYQSEIANQVRRALNASEGVDNPLSMFYPNLNVLQPKSEDSK